MASVREPEPLRGKRRVGVRHAAAKILGALAGGRHGQNAEVRNVPTLHIASRVVILLEAAQPGRAPDLRPTQSAGGAGVRSAETATRDETVQDQGHDQGRGGVHAGDPGLQPDPTVPTRQVNPADRACCSSCCPKCKS